MLSFLIRWFMGYCRFSAQTANPVRLLNRLHDKGITFRYPKIKEYRLQFTCTKASAAPVYRQLTAMGVGDITVKGIGLPFLLSTVWRKILFVTALLFLIGTPLVMQYFLVEIKVTGNQSLSREVIIEALEEIGIKPYAYLPGLELKTARQQLLLRQQRLSWASFHLDGNKLTVWVHEKKQNKPITPKEPCNIVAAYDGIICKMDVLYGKQVVKGKTAVRKGQLLVSGFLETEAGKLSYLHAQATVIAQIEMQKSYTVDLNAAEYVPTGKSKSRYSIELFGNKIPLYAAFGTQKMPYTVQTQTHTLQLGKTGFPLALQKETHTFYKEQTANLTKTDARAILEQRFAEYEIYELSDAAIVSKGFELTQKGSKITMTGHYCIQRDIAQCVKIEVDG